MFKNQNQIKVLDRIEHFAKPLTPAQLDGVFKSDPNDLILESVSLEDLENTLLFQCEPVPQMMLEAFKSKASMLGQRMKKFANQLSKKTGEITAGDIEIGKPRKSGAVAVQIAKIPLSDGQSVSIAFHAPDNDPLKINSDDTLIAFRFMINSRDVTHTVAPKGGMDVSLKEATTRLGSLVTANSEKFAAAQEKKNANAAALQQAQEQAQSLEEQTAELNEETDSLESESDALSKKISRAQTKIDTQNEIQEELRKQLSTQEHPAQEPATATVSAPNSGDPYRDLFDEPKLRTAMKTVQGHGPKGTNLISTLGTIADIDINGANGSDRALFVQNMTGRIKTMHKNGEQQLVDDALTMLSAFNDVADKPAVTSRNNIWKLGNVNAIESEPEQVPEESPKGDVTHVSFNESELQANLSGQDKATVQKLRGAGYEVLFDSKTGYSIVNPSGKVTSTGSTYTAFKEHLYYYSEKVTVESSLETMASNGYPNNQYENYHYLTEDTDIKPTKNSLTKLKSADLDEGEYVIEHGEYSHITVKRVDNEIHATWVVAGGLSVETITYSSLSKLKHYGTEKMEQFGSDVRKTLSRNGYTQEELDRASGATSNVVNLNGAGGEDTPPWDDMTDDERRQAVISAGFPQGYEVAQAELTDKFEQRLQANGRDAATTIPDYMNDVVKDAIALINGGQMDLSELQNENLIELVENNLTPAFPELTEEYINKQLKEALMSVIGSKNIASDWTMDKADPEDPFVYFYAPDADEDDVYGEFLVRAYDNATFSVFHSEGSPLSTESSTGLTTWDQIKSVILADYAQQQSERQSEQGQSTEPESLSEPDKDLNIDNALASDDADEAAKGRTEEQQQLMDLNANEFTSSSIYEEEGITDTTQIAKRIRAFMTQMRKSGRLPSSVKISVKKDGNGINLKLVELPENVTLYSPEFLQWEIDNPQGSLAGAPEQYSEEVRQLITFVDAFTDQFNYDKSDTMTDYFDVNFYGGRLEVDSALRRERKVDELESLEEIHHQGEESAEPTIDVNGIREALDSDSAIMLEQLEEFTNFEIKLGEQSVTLPSGNAKTFKANDEESLIDKIADVHEHLTAALEEKAKANLETLTDWQSQRMYFGNGFQGQINIGKSLSSNPDASIDGLYGDNALSAMIGTQRVLIYPVVRGGEFKFAAYSHDKAKHFGDFDNHSELEMLCIFGLGLTDKAPEQEQNGEEMEHIKKLEAIRDYTGEPEQAVIDKHQNELEAAYAYFESADSVDENEALMESAMLAITAMIEAL